jgi:hypothetical protein
MAPEQPQPQGPPPSSVEASDGSGGHAEPPPQKVSQQEVLRPRKRRVYRMPLAMRQRRDRFRRVSTDVILWSVAIGVSLWAIWMWLFILDPANRIMKIAIQDGEPYFNRALEAWHDLTSPRQQPARLPAPADHRD